MEKRCFETTDMGNINRIFKSFILLFWFFSITAVYAISDPEVFEVIESNDSRLIIAVKSFDISFVKVLSILKPLIL